MPSFFNQQNIIQKVATNLIPELRERGLIQDIIPGTEEQLAKEMTRAYVGFDPTADSLHIGSMLPIILLMHLQRAGHQPIALVGGATGMIGDPTGKSAERNLLDAATLEKNQKGIQKQLEQFLDFDTSKPNHARIVNNYDWLKDYTFLNFIRDIGKHLSVNYMMAKDSVQKRLEYGLSFTEFSYQLIQGYDFYYLNKEQGVKLQFGGADQWGNITTGTELIRRMGGSEAFAFTCPLLKKADGGKFGKTEGGNVWLDPEKTSPYKFYQFWRNVKDEDVKNLIRIFTFLPLEEIQKLEQEHDAAPHLYILQTALAKEITSLVHGEDAVAAAIKTSQILFNGTKEDLSSLTDAQVADITDGLPVFSFDKAALAAGKPLIDFLVEGEVFPSKGEARKMIQNGGVFVNKEKWPADQVNITADHILADKYIYIQKGKKNYFLAKVMEG